MSHRSKVSVAPRIVWPWSIRIASSANEPTRVSHAQGRRLGVILRASGSCALIRRVTPFCGLSSVLRFPECGRTPAPTHPAAGQRHTRSRRKAGGLDVVADLASPLPATVTAELLGVPTEDFGLFKKWSDDLAGSFTWSPDTMHRAHVALRSLTAYVAQLVAQQPRSASDSVLDAPRPARADGGLTNDDELLAQCVMRCFRATKQRPISSVLRRWRCSTTPSSWRADAPTPS